MKEQKIETNLREELGVLVGLGLVYFMGNM